MNPSEGSSFCLGRSVLRSTRGTPGHGYPSPQAIFEQAPLQPRVDVDDLKKLEAADAPPENSGVPMGCSVKLDPRSNFAPRDDDEGRVLNTHPWRGPADAPGGLKERERRAGKATGRVAAPARCTGRSGRSPTALNFEETAPAGRSR
jgi:hypothetical protein